MYKQGPYNEIYISSQSLEVTYEIKKDNFTKKPFSIYPQNVESILMYYWDNVWWEFKSIMQCVIFKQDSQAYAFIFLC